MKPIWSAALLVPFTFGVAARSRFDETLEWWNQIGNKLIAMAKDFPEDKYDFKMQKDERTFGQNLVHVAAVDYDLIRNGFWSRHRPRFWCGQA